jgi:hypothetical protein
VGVGLLAGMPLPLSAFCMIVICLLTDVFGSLSLVYEEPEADVMLIPPRDTKRDKLVDLRLMRYAFLQVGFVPFYSPPPLLGHRTTPAAREVTFSVLCWADGGSICISHFYPVCHCLLKCVTVRTPPPRPAFRWGCTSRAWPSACTSWRRASSATAR